MEEIIGTLRGVTGHSFDVVYDLVFTSERVIAVNIMHPLDIPYKFTWAKALIGSGLDIRDRKIKLADIAQARRDVERNAAPDELVKANPHNFALSYGEITSITVKHGLLDWKLVFEVVRTGKPIRIQFNLSKNHVPEAKRLISLKK